MIAHRSAGDMPDLPLPVIDKIFGRNLLQTAPQW
jgi:hypothetical protein